MENNWHSVQVEPSKSDTYEVKNNSGVNGGIGEIDYVVGKGWQIPESIKSFYKILQWRNLETPKAEPFYPPILIMHTSFLACGQ
jgi:hypothetical protein